MVDWKEHYMTTPFTRLGAAPMITVGVMAAIADVFIRKISTDIPSVISTVLKEGRFGT